jgi:hypothetical protein
MGHAGRGVQRCERKAKRKNHHETHERHEKKKQTRQKPPGAQDSAFWFPVFFVSFVCFVVIPSVNG